MSQPETALSNQFLPIAGEVRVSPQVMAALVRRAAAATAGIHTLEDMPAESFVRDTSAGLLVEVSIWIKHGSSIEATAAALEARLRTDLAYALGRPVAIVRVYVLGLREKSEVSSQ